MSSIVKVTDSDAFVYGYDDSHWTHLRGVLRRFGNPAEFYCVTIEGNNVGAMVNTYPMLEWCLEHVAFSHPPQKRVRTEYAALSAKGHYFFVHHSDAIAFYFTWGDRFK